MHPKKYVFGLYMELEQGNLSNLQSVLGVMYRTVWPRPGHSQVLIAIK